MAETVLGDRLVKIDHTDLIRRKVDTKRGKGSLVMQLGEPDESHWVRGKFEKTKVEIEVQHYRSGK